MSKIKELYFSVDIEADGKAPIVNSMLSFGCAVFTEEGGMISTFERNLETLPFAVADADTIEWWLTQPKAWEACRQNLVSPESAMIDFDKWVSNLSAEHEAKPVFVAYPAGFDFTFIYVYLVKFVGKSVFSFDGIDIKTYGMALTGLPFKESTKRNFPRRWFNKKHRHNHIALDDAIYQGEMFIKMRKERLLEIEENTK